MNVDVELNREQCIIKTVSFHRGPTLVDREIECAVEKLATNICKVSNRLECLEKAPQRDFFLLKTPIEKLYPLC